MIIKLSSIKLTWKDFSFLCSFFKRSEKLRSPVEGGGGGYVWCTGAEGQRRGSELESCSSASGLLRHLFTNSRGESESSSFNSRAHLEGGDALSTSLSRSQVLPGDHICLFLVDKFSGNSSSSSANIAYHYTVLTVLHAFKFKVGRVKWVVCGMTYEICTGVSMFHDGYVNVYSNIILVPNKYLLYTSSYL